MLRILQLPGQWDRWPIEFDDLLYHDWLVISSKKLRTSLGEKTCQPLGCLPKGISPTKVKCKHDHMIKSPIEMFLHLPLVHHISLKNNIVSVRRPSNGSSVLSPAKSQSVDQHLCTARPWERFALETAKNGDLTCKNWWCVLLQTFTWLWKSIIFPEMIYIYEGFFMIILVPARVCIYIYTYIYMYICT